MLIVGKNFNLQSALRSISINEKTEEFDPTMWHKSFQSGVQKEHSLSQRHPLIVSLSLVRYEEEISDSR